MKKLYFILSAQFGLNPLRFIRSLLGLPAFVKDWLLFRKMYKELAELVKSIVEFTG